MTRPASDAANQLNRLLDIMTALRDPSTGCSWDQAQTFETIAPYTIEEAYEVADAIARRDWTALPDELGDLLLQVIYYASLGQSDLSQSENRFDFATIACLIADKMVRRHPHVFGDEAVRNAGMSWDDNKAVERHARAEHGALAGIPLGLPALSRAAKLCVRAARVGFDWQQPALVVDKVAEELVELRAELDTADPVRLRDEIGDVLFTVANLSRSLGLDPETCLREANAKFQRRFEHMEQSIEASGRSLAEASLDEMEAGWQAAKAAEPQVPSAQAARSVS